MGGLLDPVASPPLHVPRVGSLVCGSDPIHFCDGSTGGDTKNLVFHIKLSLKGSVRGVGRPYVTLDAR